MHVNFLENKPNVAGGGPQWLFDIDILTNTINYHPVSAGNRTNGNAGLEINPDAGSAGKEKVPDQQYILLPLMHTSSYIPSSSNEDKSSPEDDAGKKNEVKEPAKEDDLNDSGEDTNADRTNRINTGSSPLNSDKNAAIPSSYPDDPLMPELEDIDTPYNTSIFENAYDDKDVGAEADMNNLDSSINVWLSVQYGVSKELDMAYWAFLRVGTTFDIFQNIIFLFMDTAYRVLLDMAYVVVFDRTKEGNKAWKEKAPGWKLCRKAFSRIVVRNEARLVAQGFRQEEGIDYDEMDVKCAFLYGTIEDKVYVCQPPGFLDLEFPDKVYKSSAFLYGTIEEEVYVIQPLGFVDPAFLDKVYKVEKALYGLHQAPRAWYETLSTYLIENGFRRGTIYKTLFIKKIKNDILLVQKFGYSSVKLASTPMETHKPLTKDENGAVVDVHLYRSMIGSLMYLTSSRPDIMFVICACLRFQVQPKASHMHAVKRFFRYIKGQPTLGLLYPKDSPLELIAYSDSDYAGASLDRKSTTGDKNIADLLTKAFDVTRFKFLIASIEFTMANLKYSDWHNMVAFLKKPTESEGFTKIVDFLKGSSLRTLANGIQKIIASIDNKEYIITKASVRSKIQLADATGDHVPLLPAMLAGAAPDQDKVTTTRVRVETEGTTTTTSGLDTGLDSGNIHKSPLRSYKAPLLEGNTSGSVED
ncbi:putative ribonuclease H-like domain-containing protein, partial [Tanacetum coccineum]